MGQVIYRNIENDGITYECKIERFAMGFVKSECEVVIYAPTDIDDVEEMYSVVMVEDGGVWTFRKKELPQPILNLQEKLTLIINHYTHL